MTGYIVHLNETATLWLEVREPDGSLGRVDLDAPTAAMLATRGHGLGTGPSDGVELGAVCADGPVRFFAGGKRISTAAGLAAVAGGIVAIVTDYARRALAEDTELS